MIQVNNNPIAEMKDFDKDDDKKKEEQKKKVKQRRHSSFTRHLLVERFVCNDLCSLVEKLI